LHRSVRIFLQALDDARRQADVGRHECLEVDVALDEVRIGFPKGFSVGSSQRTGGARLLQQRSLVFERLGQSLGEIVDACIGHARRRRGRRLHGHRRRRSILLG
ncbi:MAG: hypothetical protein ACK55I_43120, partial [bacterium]